MCQSVAEGGKRCAAHTRPSYLESLATFSDKNFRDRGIGDYEKLFTSTRLFASTPKGNREVKIDHDEATKKNDYDLARVLEDGLVYGLLALEKQREADKAAKNIVQDNLVDQNRANPLDAIKVAIALGYPAPSFVGGKYYSLYVSHPVSEDYDCLGDYPTRELANKGLIAYIKNKFGSFPIGRQILADDGEIYWAKAGAEGYILGDQALEEEIIRNFFSSPYQAGYAIKERTLVGELDTKLINKGSESSTSPLPALRDFISFN